MLEAANSSDFILEFEHSYILASYIIYPFEALLFYFIVYLLLHPSSKYLQDYRYYILFNFLTLHIFCLAKFFAILTFRIEVSTFCNHGLFKWFGPLSTLFLVMIYATSFTFHLFAFLLCFLYQYSHITINKFIQMFEKKKISIIVYVGISTVYSLIFNFLVWRSSNLNRASTNECFSLISFDLWRHFSRLSINLILGIPNIVCVFMFSMFILRLLDHLFQTVTISRTIRYDYS